LAVQWLNKALLISVYLFYGTREPLGLCFVSSFTHAGLIFSGTREPFGVVVADSFVLRNSQLLLAANRDVS